MTGKKFNQAARQKFEERLCTVNKNPVKGNKSCGRLFGIFAAISAIASLIAGLIAG